MRAQIINHVVQQSLYVDGWNTKHRIGIWGRCGPASWCPSGWTSSKQTAQLRQTHTGCSTLRTTGTQGTVRNHQSNAIFIVIDTSFGVKNQAQRTSTQSLKNSGMQVVLEEGMWECCRV
jgi:hypothetical protein